MYTCMRVLMYQKEREEREEKRREEKRRIADRVGYQAKETGGDTKAAVNHP